MPVTYLLSQSQKYRQETIKLEIGVHTKQTKPTKQQFIKDSFIKKQCSLFNSFNSHQENMLEMIVAVVVTVGSNSNVTDGGRG